jgi:hypothetical protein
MSTIIDVIGDAYREIGVVGYEDEMDGPQAVLARRMLYRMLQAWQNTYHLWLEAEQTVTLTTAASYTLDPRPVRVYGCRLVRDGVETPMQELTRQEYLEMPLKTSTGLPTCYYYDSRRASGVLYVWPLLAAADGETIKVDYEIQVTEPVLASGTIDVPPEWYEAVVYNLALRLAGPFERPVDIIGVKAANSLSEALAADREGSVFLMGGDA